MAYLIEGSGPRFPDGHQQMVETAAGAITALAAVEKLCGHAAAFDSAGQALTLADLQTLMRNEIARKA